MTTDDIIDEDNLLDLDIQIEEIEEKKDNFQYTEEQKDARNELEKFILNNPYKKDEIVLSGPAGSGKTTIMKDFENTYENNYHFIYMAPTHKARKVLEKTLNKERRNLKKKKVLTIMKGLGITLEYNKDGKCLKVRNENGLLYDFIYKNLNIYDYDLTKIFADSRIYLLKEHMINIHKEIIDEIKNEIHKDKLSDIAIKNNINHKYKKNKNIFKEIVLIIDECSMITSDIYRDLKKLPYKKIYLGDINQLGPIEDENSKYTQKYSPVFHQDMKIIKLTQVLRANSIFLKKINNYFIKSIAKNKNVSKIIQVFKKRNIHKNKSLINSSIQRFIQNNEEFIIITFSNKEKKLWNDVVVEILRNKFNSNERWLPEMNIIVNETFYYFFDYLRDQEDLNILEQLRSSKINLPYNYNIDFDHSEISIENYDDIIKFGNTLYSCDVLTVDEVYITLLNHKIQNYFNLSRNIPVYILSCSSREDHDNNEYIFIQIINKNDIDYVNKKKNEKKREIINTIEMMNDVNNPTYNYSKEEIQKMWKEYYYYLTLLCPPIEQSSAITSHKAQGSTYKNVIADLTNIEKCLKNRDNYNMIRSMYVAISRASDTLETC